MGGFLSHEGGGVRGGLTFVTKKCFFIEGFPNTAFNFVFNCDCCVMAIYILFIIVPVNTNLKWVDPVNAILKVSASI